MYTHIIPDSWVPDFPTKYMGLRMNKFLYIRCPKRILSFNPWILTVRSFDPLDDSHPQPAAVQLATWCQNYMPPGARCFSLRCQYFPLFSSFTVYGITNLAYTLFKSNSISLTRLPRSLTLLSTISDTCTNAESDLIFENICHLSVVIFCSIVRTNANLDFLFPFPIFLRKGNIPLCCRPDWIQI